MVGVGGEHGVSCWARVRCQFLVSGPIAEGRAIAVGLKQCVTGLQKVHLWVIRHWCRHPVVVKGR